MLICKVHNCEIVIQCNKMTLVETNIAIIIIIMFMFYNTQYVFKYLLEELYEQYGTELSDKYKYHLPVTFNN